MDVFSLPDWHPHTYMYSVSIYVEFLTNPDKSGNIPRKES